MIAEIEVEVPGITTYQDGEERRLTTAMELPDLIHAAVYVNGPVSFTVEEIPEVVDDELIIVIVDDTITIGVRSQLDV